MQDCRKELSQSRESTSFRQQGPGGALFCWSSVRFWPSKIANGRTAASAPLALADGVPCYPTDGVVDDQLIEGYVARIGTYSYTTVEGARRLLKS